MRSNFGFALALLIVFAACGEAHHHPVADGGERVDDDRSASDARVPADASTEGGRSIPRDVGPQSDPNQSTPETVAYPTDIVVENVGTEPILLNPNCGAIWATVTRGDKVLDITRYCKSPCDTPGMGGCPGICLTTQKLVVPSERKTLAWDGKYFERSQRCDEVLAPDRSTELTVTVCWDAVLPWSAEPECASATFRYGDEREVVVRAQREVPKSRTTTLVLRNTQDQPIEVIADQCSHQGVFSIDKDKTSMLSVNCACVCNAATREGACPGVSCGACSADVTKTLQPGESFEFVWDQKLWHSTLPFCVLPYALAPDDLLQMRACWRASAASDQECASATVKATDARVEFTNAR